MKKKIFGALIISVLALGLTGCGSKKTEYKTLKLKDEEKGYTTTMKYLKADGYEVEKSKEDNSVILLNDAENFKITMNYEETTNEEYEAKQGRKLDRANYKEYEFGKYKGYAYSSDGSSNLKINVLLQEEKEDSKAVVLYMYIERIDSKKDTSVYSIFNGDDVQEILDTIKFSIKK